MHLNFFILFCTAQKSSSLVEAIFYAMQGLKEFVVVFGNNSSWRIPFYANFLLDRHAFEKRNESKHQKRLIL